MGRLTHKELVKRLRRAQRLAEEHPRLYGVQVRAMMLAGRLYLLGLVFTAIIAGFVVVPWLCHLVASGQSRLWGLFGLLVVGLSLGGLLLSLSQLTRIRFPVPAGIILRSSDAPGLFKQIEDLRGQLGVPRLHRLLLSPNLNAGVCIRPSYGLLGRDEAFLEIGLPLLQLLDSRQCNAVLAHELGHVAGKANRFRRRVHRHLQRWEQLHESFQDQGGSVLISLFVEWYLPRLRIMTWAMNRSLEFEADRIARDCAGPETTASALTLIASARNALDHDFWPSVIMGACQDPVPPDDVMQRQGAFLRSLETRRILRGWARWEMRRNTPPTSTHPPLAERLVLLGPGDPTTSLQAEGTESACAAEELLGETEPELTSLLSATWAHVSSPDWRKTFHEATGRRAVMEQLRRRHSAGQEPLDWRELWRLAEITEALEGRRAAFPYIREALERDRTSVDANLAFGRVLLEEGDDRGIPHVEYAMDANPFLTEEGCALVCSLLYRQGRFEDAGPYEERAARFAVQFADAVAEREEITPHDTFMPHDLDASEVSGLVQSLAPLPPVTGAWLARKQVEHLPERDLFVLVLQPRNLKEWNAATLRAIVELLDLPGDLVLILPRGGQKRLARVIQRTAGTRLFDLSEETS